MKTLQSILPLENDTCEQYCSKKKKKCCKKFKKKGVFCKNCPKA